MGDRTVPWDEDEICDECGAKGAYDYMGDCICQDCLDKGMTVYKQDIQEEDERLSKIPTGPQSGDISK